MIKKLVERLEKSKGFAEWRKNNPESYFTSAFFMIGDAEPEWLLSYYDKKNDTITSFSVGKEIRVKESEEVFKKEGVVKKFDFSKLKIGLQQALGLAEKFQKKNYPKEVPMKRIIVVQNLKLGQVWNITYITERFNTLNMKLSTETGKMLKYELSSLFDLPKK